MVNHSSAVEHVAAGCQVWIGYALVQHEPPDRESIARAFLDVRLPANELERRAVGYTLITFAVHFAETIHRNFHQRFRSPRACAFAAPVLLPSHDASGELLLYDSVGQWAERLRRDFIRHHDSCAHRARRLLEDPGGTTLSLEQLASRLATGRRSLERQFLHEIGVTIAEYRTRHRVIALVRSLRAGSGKRDTLAQAVGWRSKKSVYDACERVLGKTPADIQRLSDTEASCLEAKLLDPHSPRDE